MSNRRNRLVWPRRRRASIGRDARLYVDEAPCSDDNLPPPRLQQLLLYGARFIVAPINTDDNDRRKPPSGIPQNWHHYSLTRFKLEIVNV